MKHFKATAIAAVLMALAGCQQANEDTAADEAAVRANQVAWADAYNAGDAERLASLYWEDAVVQPPGVPAAVGREAIRAFLAGDIAESKAAGLTLNLPDSGAIDVSGDLAYDAGGFTATDASGATVATGKFLTVFQKRDGKWLFLRDTWNSDTAPPAAPVEPATEPTAASAT
jgi:uncharacterized protein (TIGR02246 family)